MHSTIHAVCVQKDGKTELKAMFTDIKKKKKKKFFFLVKRAGRHFGFLKRAGRHQKAAGRRALQKRPRQNTDVVTLLSYVILTLTLRPANTTTPINMF